MAIQSDRVARVRATVVQANVQGLSPAFPRICKGCKGIARACLTCVRARTHRHAHLRMRVRFHETLATLATLAPSIPNSLNLNDLANVDPARVEQGLGLGCKALSENEHDDHAERTFAAVHIARGTGPNRGRPAGARSVRAYERRGSDPHARLWAGGRSRVDAWHRDGDAARAHLQRPRRRAHAALIAWGWVTGPSGGAAAIAVWLSAIAHYSNPARFFELHELNRSLGVVQ